MPWRRTSQALDTFDCGRPLLLDPSFSRVYILLSLTFLPRSTSSEESQFKEEVMSFRRAFWALAVAVCLGAPATLHAQGDYLDVFVVKVKPEKVTEYEALTKKFVDANRRYNGDRWIAMETVYGEGNVYQFTSTRKDYADVEKTLEAEMAAVNKALGKEAAQKMMQDFSNCTVWTRSELRKRRWDLSRKAPQDPEAYAKMIGESRLLRTTAVHIRPGHVPDFEALMKDAKEAAV
jgi:hypothetical protein